MPLTPYAPPMGATDLLPAAAEQSIYLLNEYGRVIAAQQSEPLLKIGDSFWHAMHVTGEEQREVQKAMNSCSLHSMLFMAGNRPAVTWCYFYARTRLFTVFLPEGDVRRCLSAPAAYADALAERHVLLSHGALAHYLPWDGQLYQPTDLWLRDLERPLFDLSTLELPIYREDGTPLIGASALVDLLTWRVSALAALLGVNADTDWQGLGLSPLPYPDLAWIMACLSTLLLTVRRAATDAAVVLHAVKEGADGPVIEARFTCRDPQDSCPELLPLFGNASMRNELFEVASAPCDAGLLVLRFSMCRKELSVLGLKIDLRLQQ